MRRRRNSLVAHFEAIRKGEGSRKIDGVMEAEIGAEEEKNCV